MIYVGTPLFGSILPPVEKNRRELAEHFHVADFEVGQPTSDVRNKITKSFLQSQCTHMLMLDADMAVSIEGVNEMLQMDVDIAGGAYKSLSQGKLFYVAQPLNADLYFKNLPHRPLKVGMVGTGSLLVRRKVFEAMKYPWFSERFTPKRQAHDQVFCANARKAGFDIWLNPQIKFKHFKFINVTEL